MDVTDSGAALVQNLDIVEIKQEPKEIKSKDYQPITDSKNVEKFVADYFADIPIMVQVARCESQFRQYSGGEVLRGKQNQFDRGVMQINLYYHGDTAKKLGLDIHAIDDNVAYARYLYEKQGLKPWKSSSKCWSRFASETLGSEIAKR